MSMKPHSHEGAYGNDLARRFHVEEAPTIVTRTVAGTRLAITRTTDHSARHRVTESIPYEDAYLFAVHLAPPPRHRMWVDGRLLDQAHDPRLDLQTFDLREDSISEVAEPFDCLFFYIPRQGLDEVSDQLGKGRVDRLAITSGLRQRDPLLTSVARALATSFDNLEVANRLFMDQLALAFRAHVAYRFGGLVVDEAVGRSGLSPVQQARAKEILGQRLNGDLSLDDLAGECGLTTADFVTGFRRSTGLTVSQWLARRRIDQAKALLHGSHLSVTEIAHRCGFGTTLRFRRAFTLGTGHDPDAWRKVRRA